MKVLSRSAPGVEDGTRRVIGIPDILASEERLTNMVVDHILRLCRVRTRSEAQRDYFRVQEPPTSTAGLRQLAHQLAGSSTTAGGNGE